MTRISEARQAKANEVLLPKIRKLASTGLYIHEIAKGLGCTPQRIAGLMGHHRIDVKRADKKTIDARHRSKAAQLEREALILPPPPTAEELWKRALAGQEYADDERAAPPMPLRSFPLPGTRTGNSSLAWAG